MKVESNSVNFIESSNTGVIEGKVFGLHFPNYVLYAKPSLQFYAKKGNPVNVIIKLLERSSAVLIKYESSHSAKGNSYFTTYNNTPDVVTGDSAVNWFNSLASSRIFKLNDTPIEPETPLVEKPNSRLTDGEIECKRVLEAIFGKPFTAVRPNWLKNPESNRNLQLDFFNEELKLAVEYDKAQHYEDVESLNSKLVDVRSRDLHKDVACHVNGIILIRVPYWLKVEEIQSYIKDRIPIKFAFNILSIK